MSKSNKEVDKNKITVLSCSIIGVKTGRIFTELRGKYVRSHVVSPRNWAFNGGSKYSSYPLDLGRPSHDKNSLVMLTNNSKG